MELDLIPLLVGPFLILVGLVVWCFPPKKINNTYGYRTPRAFRNQRAWDFAQRYSAKLIVLLNGLSTIICGVVYFLVRSRKLNIESPVAIGIYTVLPAVVTLMAIVLTERALAKMEKQEK